MPDISMCQNEACPLHDYCYRFTATPNGDRQTYADFAPEEGEDKCDSYWGKENPDEL